MYADGKAQYRWCRASPDHEQVRRRRSRAGTTTTGLPLFSALIASSRQRADMPQAVHVYAQGTGETCLGQEYMFHRSRTSLHISSLQGESCNQRDNKKILINCQANYVFT
jgi:hypothetical protein